MNVFREFSSVKVPKFHSGFNSILVIVVCTPISYLLTDHRFLIKINHILVF